MDGEGVKVRIFLVRPPILGNSPPLNGTHLFEIHIIIYAEKPVNRGIAAFFGVEEGGEHPEGGARGVQEGSRVGRRRYEGPLHSSCVQNGGC